MKISVMQPYFLPYPGYFKLINDSDLFVSLDNVSFIKNGWINRNRISGRNGYEYLTLPLVSYHSGNLIKEVNVNINKRRIQNTVYHNYKGALNFDKCYGLLEEILSVDSNLIVDYAMVSLRVFCDYLGIKTKIIKASENSLITNATGVDRVLEICKFHQATDYLNLPGGKSLYSTMDFEKNDLSLHFVDPPNFEYFNKFGRIEPNLSILDVCMYLSLEQIKSKL
jgi:hypothetical protein